MGLYWVLSCYLAQFLLLPRLWCHIRVQCGLIGLWTPWTKWYSTEIFAPLLPLWPHFIPHATTILSPCVSSCLRCWQDDADLSADRIVWTNTRESQDCRLRHPDRGTIARRRRLRVKLLSWSQSSSIEPGFFLNRLVRSIVTWGCVHSLTFRY